MESTKTAPASGNLATPEAVSQEEFLRIRNGFHGSTNGFGARNLVVMLNRRSGWNATSIAEFLGLKLGDVTQCIDAYNGGGLDALERLPQLPWQGGAS